MPAALASQEQDADATYVNVSLTNCNERIVIVQTNNESDNGPPLGGPPPAAAGKNVLRLASADPARMLDVEWGGHTSDHYKARLLIQAYERKGLIRDIGEMLLHCHSDVLSINTRVNENMGRVEIDLSIRVSDFEHLAFVLNRLASIPNVYETNRIG